MLMKKIAALWAAITLALAPAFADQSSLYSPTTGTVSGLNLTNNYNSALNALSSCNSGASAPANTLSASPNAGMCWLNTSANPYKVEIYDGGQWEVVATLDPTNHWYEPIVGGGQGTLASAATTDLGSVPYSYISVTGTTTITSLGSSAPIGSIKVLSFAASLTLTYNATSLILPAGASINTSVGDLAIAIEIASGNWKVMYLPANGQPLALPSGTVVPWSITGGLPSSISGTNTTATLIVSAFTGADSTATANMSWTGTKSWAVTTGNAIGGFAGGTTLPNSATIHMYACEGASGIGVYASIVAPVTAGGSFSASSCPTGYTVYYRRLFSFTTSSAGAPNPFTADEIAGGAMWAGLTTPTLDVNGGTTGISSRSLFTVAVPLGIKVLWQGREYTSASAVVIYTSPDEPDLAPSGSTAPLADVSVYSEAIGGKILITNTSGQLGARGTAGFTYYISTAGWIDLRRN